MVGEIILIVLSFLFVLIGGVGVFLPILPGVPVAFIGLLIFGLVTDFAALSWPWLLVFFGLTILTVILDILMPLMGAKLYKSTKFGAWGSVIGVLIGISLLGPLGILVRPFVGAFVGELFGGRDSYSAFRSAKGTMVGFLAGSVIKVAIAVGMLAAMIIALV